jgi:hypothetical protein
VFKKHIINIYKLFFLKFTIHFFLKPVIIIKIFLKISSYYVEDDSFTTTININESSESAEINSLASTGTTSTVYSNKRSFIWSYCEDLRPHGWKCIVPKEDGDICGQYFSITATKGSTTNTIYHLLSQHGIVNPKAADKVFIIKLIM